MRTSNDARLWAVIKSLKIAVRRLPPNDRAANVADLVRRLEWAVANETDVTKQVTAFVQAIRRALDDEPWVHLDRTAQRLGREISSGKPHARLSQARALTSTRSRSVRRREPP
jgi:hypothetical protein